MIGPWRKSSRSGANGACVVARVANGTPQVGDSKLGDDTPTLTVSRRDLAALLDTVR